MSNWIDKIELQPSAPARSLPRPSGYEPICISVGLNGNAIRLLTSGKRVDSIFAMSEQPGFARFPKTHTTQEYDSVVSIAGAAGSEEFSISGLTITFPKIDLLPDWEVLIVASRCQRFRDGSHELNAKVYDHAGNLRREFLLGDGIEHVQTNAGGDIWVGYFDEGVYGNFGWPVDGTVGAAGLSCFNSMGEHLWNFSPPEGFDHISDCYALNVSPENVWACYYTGFPLVRINASRQVRGWNNEYISGAQSVVVKGEQILLYGGYRERATNCSLLRLSGDALDLVAEVSLKLPDNVDLSKARVIGRNDELHVFSDDEWYRFSP